jgi:hypothetical protein
VLQLVGARKPLDLRLDALERYESARDRAKLVLREWERAQSPFVLEHRNGVVGAHPLYRALLDSERHVERMRQGVQAEESRRWQVPVPRPGRSRSLLPDLSPAAELRSIRGGKS